MLARIDDVRASFLVKRPVCILPTIARAAAIVQIVIRTRQGCEARYPFRSIMIDSKIQIWGAAIGLPAINTNTGELYLQVLLIGSIVLKKPWSECAPMLFFRV